MTQTLDGFVLNGTEYNIKDASAHARIDELVGGENTPTEGNSELLDIRVDLNGKTYNSAGEAVRGQVNEVMEQVNKVAQSLEETSKELSELQGDASVTLVSPNGTKFLLTVSDDGELSATKVE